MASRWPGEVCSSTPNRGRADTIQFCRYAALVAARGGVPVLTVQPPVERLMHSLAVVKSGIAEVLTIGEALVRSDVNFDCECPLMSLPEVFGTTVETTLGMVHISAPMQQISR